MSIPPKVQATLLTALDESDILGCGNDTYSNLDPSDVTEARRWLAFADEDDGTITRTRAAAELSVALWLAVPAAVTPVFETVDQIWRNMERRGAAKLSVLLWLAAPARSEELVWQAACTKAALESQEGLAGELKHKIYREKAIEESLRWLADKVVMAEVDRHTIRDELLVLAAADKPSGKNGGGAPTMCVLCELEPVADPGESCEPCKRAARYER